MKLYSFLTPPQVGKLIWKTLKTMKYFRVHSVDTYMLILRSCMFLPWFSDNIMNSHECWQFTAL